MEKEKVLVELRALNNLIRRYLFFSSSMEEIKSITGNNGWIIAYLGQNEDKDIFQKDIEERFTITRSTASRVLSLMEQKDLIKREAVKGDARLKKISLTEKSKKISKVMEEDSYNLERKLLEGFSEKEVDELLWYFVRMRENIHPKPKAENEKQKQAELKQAELKQAELK